MNDKNGCLYSILVFVMLMLGIDITKENTNVCIKCGKPLSNRYGQEICVFCDTPTPYL